MMLVALLLLFVAVASCTIAKRQACPPAATVWSSVQVVASKVVAVGFCGRGNPAIAASSDGGHSFDLRPFPNSTLDLPTHIKANGSTVVIAGPEFGVQITLSVSTDKAATFNDVTLPFVITPDLDVGGLEVIDGTFFIGTPSGHVFHSSTPANASSWTHVDLGDDHQVLNDFVGAGSSIVVVGDATTNVVLVAPMANLSDWRSVSGEPPSSITLWGAANNDSDFLVGVGHYLVASSSRAVVAWSDSLGDKWQVDLLPTSDQQLIAVTWHQPCKCWVGVGSQIVRSTDGVNWSVVPTANMPDALDLTNLLIDVRSVASVVIAVGEQNRIWHSHDNGETWEQSQIN